MSFLRRRWWLSRRQLVPLPDHRVRATAPGRAPRRRLQSGHSPSRRRRKAREVETVKAAAAAVSPGATSPACPPATPTAGSGRMGREGQAANRPSGTWCHIWGASRPRSLPISARLSLVQLPVRGLAPFAKLLLRYVLSRFRSSKTWKNSAGESRVTSGRRRVLTSGCSRMARLSDLICSQGSICVVNGRISTLRIFRVNLTDCI